MSTPTTSTRPTLAQLRAQLQELRDEQRAHKAPELRKDATLADKMTAHAEWAERRAALVERERDLWSEVVVATYVAADQTDCDNLLPLLRDAVISLSGHVSLEAMEARRHADGSAAAAARRAGASA